MELMEGGGHQSDVMLHACHVTRHTATFLQLLKRSMSDVVQQRVTVVWAPIK